VVRASFNDQTFRESALIFCGELTPADFQTAFKRLEEQSRELERKFRSCRNGSDFAIHWLIAMQSDPSRGSFSRTGSPRELPFRVVFLWQLQPVDFVLQIQPFSNNTVLLIETFDIPFRETIDAP
jgi:hypothetical protein